MWHTDTKGLYPAVKKNDIMKIPGKYIELINKILRKVTQAQKGKCGLFPLI